MAKILFHSIDTLVRDARRVEHHVDVLISRGRVEAVGRDLDRGDAGDRQETVTRVDCRRKTMIPGLVNAHTHLYQCFLRGITDTLSLKPWNEAVTFPFAHVFHQLQRGQNDVEAAYWWTMLGCLEMIKSGITCFVNMDLTADSGFKAYHDAGLRSIGAITAVDRWLPRELQRDVAARKQEIVDFINKWQPRPEGPLQTKSASKPSSIPSTSPPVPSSKSSSKPPSAPPSDQQKSDPLVQVFIGPSTPFACSADFLNWQMDLAEQYHLGVQIHVAETRWEVEQAIKEWGRPPLAYLHSIGFLRKPITAVHCVHLSEAEIDLAQEQQVTPVYNPKSNMKLGSGIAPVPLMLKKGLHPALATDGPASNDLLNMFEEMRSGLGLQKACRQDPAVLSASDMFAMATEYGARALGLNGGILDPGKNADFVLLSMEGPWSAPVHDPIQNLVYCGMPANVESVYVAGKPVLLAGRFPHLNEDEIVSQAVDVCKRVFGEVRSRSPLEAGF